jgi:hypothetical protein
MGRQVCWRKPALPFVVQPRWGWLRGATVTQGRRSCLAPTLGFVVERRWRSMCRPWRSMPGNTDVGTNTGIDTGTGTDTTNAKGVQCPFGAQCPPAPAPTPASASVLRTPNRLRLHLQQPRHPHPHRHRCHERQRRSHNKGQGCRRKAATLSRPEKHHNPNGVAYVGAAGITPMCRGFGQPRWGRG